MDVVYYFWTGLANALLELQSAGKKHEVYRVASSDAQVVRNLVYCLVRPGGGYFHESAAFSPVYILSCPVLLKLW